MQSRVVGFRLVLWLAVASFGTAASAAVVGDLKTGSAGTMTVTLGSVGFNSDPSAVGGGNAEVATGTSLTFAGCASGVLGSPGCLTAAEGITVFSPLTLSTVLPVTSYLTFAAHASLVYSLTSVGPGSANLTCAALSIGDSCSVFAGSPLLLTRSATGTTITFAVSGKASDTGTGGLAAGSNYTGQFTAMISGQTPSQIQLFFCPSGTCVAADFSSGRSLTTSQSGDFLATAPPTPTPTRTPTNTPTPTP
jgi:hypothetical protein